MPSNQLIFKYPGFLPYIIVAFLNAVVDLGHKITIQNTIFKVYDGQQQIILTAIVNALILLPFILLFYPAGICSDQYPKHKVMQISSWTAVIVTLGITLFYYLGWFWPAFAMTFILAVQSAFYSPAKYGYIKELVGKTNLARANGFVQATTTTGILTGIFLFSILFEYFLEKNTSGYALSLLVDIAPVAWALVALSVIQLFLSYRLPERTAARTTALTIKAYFNWQNLTVDINNVFTNKIIFLCIIGLSIFWAISQVMLAAYPAYAKDTLNITSVVTIQGTLASAGFGIIIGSMIAGRIAKDNIPVALIPVGALGIMLCLFMLPYLDNKLLPAINFLMWGCFGGFLLVPLNALIQFHAHETKLGRVLATNNFIQNITMLTFLGLTVLFALYGIDSLGLFNMLLGVAICGSLYATYKVSR